MPFSTDDLLPPSWPRPVARMLDRLTGLATLQRLYAAAGPFDAPTFPERALAALGITVGEVPASELDRVPREGPLLVVANHPHGALDGLVAASLLRGVRADVKILGTSLLTRVPEMRPHIIPVDNFQPGSARNTGGVRAARNWLEAGHVLVVFPAGTVAHVVAADGRIVDGPWHDGAARLAAHTSAPVLPLHIAGRNSRLFVAAGRLSPWLRTGLLPRELLWQRGARVSVAVGRMVSNRRLAALGDASTQTAYLRVRTHGLAVDAPPRGSLMRLSRRTRPAEPIVAPVDADALAREVASLPETTRLVASSPWSVRLVTAAQAPLALREIARLREMTFRGVGEGTGRPMDTDRFDRHYRHLFVWHEEQRVIAGAYRLAASDDVLTRQGLHGLYTRTLFRYSTALLRDLGPALELGRSFVRAEFQRDYQPLLLLWRGIGALVAAEPRYRMLFGPVSISAEYGPTTRQLLARMLLAGRGSLLQSFVVPRRPLPPASVDGTDALVQARVAGTLQEVDALVRELESDRRGLPVLLRHYLKLNARLLGFSVDPAFGNVVDGLIVVDLLAVDRGLLARYLGREAAATFLAAHGVPRAAAPVAVPA